MARGPRRGRGRGRGGRARGQPPAQSDPAMNENRTTHHRDQDPDPRVVAPSAYIPAPTEANDSHIDLPPATTVPMTRADTSISTRGTLGRRLRPRIIRRDEAERESIAREEAQKERERAAEDSRQRPRSRYRGRRSRGNVMGVDSTRPANLTNPFYRSGQAPSHKSSLSRLATSTRTSRQNSSSIRQDNKPAQTTLRDGPRINADKLDASINGEDSGDEDLGIPDLAKSLGHGILPMGISRTEHKRTELVVATAAELAAKEMAGEQEGLWLEGEAEAGHLEDITDATTWHAAPKGARQIKRESGMETAPLDVPSIDFDASRRPNAHAELNVQPTIQPIVLPIAQPIAGNRPLSQEDFEQLEEEADLKLMLQELATTSLDGEDAGDGVNNGQRSGLAGNEGRMYLFQFPPIMPPLHRVTRPDLQAEGETEDIVMAEDGSTTKLAEPTHDADMDKHNDDNTDKQSEAPPSGYLGKLVIRKSGKAELDWGGMTFNMRVGMKRNFLSSAVLVDLNEDEEPDAYGHSGRAYGMGNIMGHFVLAPQWKDMNKEWVVSEEDLKAPTEA